MNNNKIIAAFLCFFAVGGIALSVLFNGGNVASASSSLPGIVALKNSGKEYTILEIVPDTSQAAFAWYVGGSEPVNSTKLSVAYSGDSGGYEASYMSTTTMLQNQNYLMGSSKNSDSSQFILQFLGEVNGNSGGFENNEWFQRYVLDWTEDETMANIRVLTVSPSQVTMGHLDLADMIVLSGGYYYPDTNTSPSTFSTIYTENLANDVTDSIISRASTADVAAGMPIILDRRAYVVDGGEGLNSNRLFHEILKENPQNVKSGVYGSVFYFSSVNSASEISNGVSLANGGLLGLSGSQSLGYLITPQFNEVFSATESSVTGTFGDVVKSIQSENATRGGVDLLSEEISMARVIRYLIGGSEMNSSVQYSDKTSISILSIQPSDSSNVSGSVKVGLPTDVNATEKSDQVTWEELEAWTGISRYNMTVVEKTINELNMSTEALTGTYDMIYIGNDVSGGSYSTFNEVEYFGTSFASGNNLSFNGMTASDSNTPTTSYTLGSNDLSNARYREILDFTTSGRAVVLAPYLCAGLNWRTDVTAPSSVTVDAASNMYKFLSNASGRSNVLRQDLLIAGTDGVEGNSDDTAAHETVVNAVNLATPSITFSLLSAQSAGNDVETLQPTLLGNGEVEYALEYIFQINNQSVATSAGVSYKMFATLDSNGDGTYDTDLTALSGATLEQLQTSLDGTLVVDDDGNPLRESIARFDNLNQDQYYRFTASLPETISGLVSWKMEVLSYEDLSLSSSVTSYSLVPTSSTKTISVLQLLNGYGNSDALSEYQEIANSLNDNYNFVFDMTTLGAIDTSSNALNVYDIILIGYDVDPTLWPITNVVSNYDGIIMFASPSMTAEDVSEHAYAPAYTAGLAFMDDTQLTAYYSDSEFGNLATNSFVRYYDDMYYTNIVLSSGVASLNPVLNTLVSAVSISEELEASGGVVGGLLISDYYNMSQLLSDSGRSIELTPTMLTSLENNGQIFMKTTDDVQGFTINLRVIDENGNVADSIDTAILRDIELEVLVKEAETEMTETFTYKIGDTIDCFNSSKYAGSSKALMSFYLLPGFNQYFEAEKEYTIQAYITKGNVTTASAFKVELIRLDNLAVGNDFFYMNYVLDNDGFFTQVDSNGDYVAEGGRFIPYLAECTPCAGCVETQRKLALRDLCCDIHAKCICTYCTTGKPNVVREYDRIEKKLVDVEYERCIAMVMIRLSEDNYDKEYYTCGIVDPKHVCHDSSYLRYTRDTNMQTGLDHTSTGQLGGLIPQG